MIAFLACGVMVGQVPKSPKPAFEVVSIKPAGEFDIRRVGGYGTNAAGYFAKGLPLSMTVAAAYFPPERMNRPMQTPGWPAMMVKDAYDIEAKFDEPTAEAWKHLTDDQRWEMLRPMLQAMLAERCKLKAHMTMVDEPSYELVIAKHGPNLKETAPGAEPPDHAFQLSDGAMWATYLINPNLKTQPDWIQKSKFKDHFVFYRTSMPVFAAWLSTEGLDKQVVDHTGLKGKYDFMLPKQTRQQPSAPAPGEATDPADSPRWVFDLSGIGLELRPTKAPEPTLVIDHIEKPTPN